jgi:hypothetical protein
MERLGVPAFAVVPKTVLIKQQEWLMARRERPSVCVLGQKVKRIVVQR